MRGPRTAKGTVGLWVAVPEAYGAGASAVVVEEELAYRLPGALFRRFCLLGEGGPNPFDSGRPTEALGTWGPDRAAELAEQLLCIVVVGDVADPQGPDASDPVIEGLGPDLEREVPVVWTAVGISFEPEGPEAFGAALEERPYVTVRDETSRARLRALGVGAEIVPDPVFLLPRIWGVDLLERRLRHLRAMGWYPDGGWTLVAQGNAAGLPHMEETAAAIERIVEGHEDAAVVVLSTGPIHGDDEFAAALEERLRTPARRIPEAGLQDVAAAIALSDGFVGSSLHGNITAAAYGRPHAILGWGGESKLTGFAELIEAEECLASLPADLPEAFEKMEARGPRPDVVEELQKRVDRHFDRVAEMAREAAAGRARVGEVDGEEARRRALRDLREAYEARGRMLALGRWGAADELTRQREEVRALREETRALREEVAWLRRTVADREHDVEERDRRIDEILRSRSWRATAWLRALGGLARKLMGRG